jgi:hypothetical protein
VRDQTSKLEECASYKVFCYFLLLRLLKNEDKESLSFCNMVKLFLACRFGRDWKKIEDFVGTKTTIQESIFQFNKVLTRGAEFFIFLQLGSS